MGTKATTTRRANRPKTRTYAGMKHVAAPSGIFKPKMVLRDTGELVQIIRVGVPASDAGKLCKHFKMSVDRMAVHVSGSPAKYQKRVDAGKFSSQESDRLVRLARLMNAAKALHDDNADGARMWMESPKEALGGATPLEYAETEVGAREVEDLIGRLEHGVFS